MEKYNHILAKGETSGSTSLIQHLTEVALVAEKIAQASNMDASLARKGAILHDIGKVSPLFQQVLKKGYKRTADKRPFRHEIASLFFLSLINEKDQAAIIEMIAAHHKSIHTDSRSLGIIDLDNNNEDSFEFHASDFETWSKDALGILNYFGLSTHNLTYEDAKKSYYTALQYCKKPQLGFSQWKGLLLGADHFASGLSEITPHLVPNLFSAPDLTFYNRKNQLYPLSHIEASDSKPHTLVTAPTGAGKTDYLLRRCKGRVFYTLPFQASINAMYNRFKNDLKDTNADIRVLHAASTINVENGKIEEKILQRHIGASIKVLTPHQIAAIVFGTKGYEAMIIDLQGCDVILDEIHTYTEIAQAIVLKIIEILKNLKCRIHVGTATMPTALYKKILNLLEEEKVLQVKLPDELLETFNRHIIHKVDDINETAKAISKAIDNKQKVLIVCNQIATVQSYYNDFLMRHPTIPIMLIHSRYKRKQRSELEKKLKEEYNESKEACIVLSTQVVEVSLDISFDLMITECAPLDALIQRFGRINRKRNESTIGSYKSCYVIAPPANAKDALPYLLTTLQKSYDALDDGKLLQEKHLQEKIDTVYPSIPILDINMSVVFSDGEWKITKLFHNPKSALLELLDIDSVVCIVEEDKEEYINTKGSKKMSLEIPVSYNTVAYNNLDKLKDGIKPFIIPDRAYSNKIGFLKEFARPEFYNVLNRFL